MTLRLASIALLALVSLSGCFWGMFFPSSTEVELAHRAPLRAPVGEIRTVAMALPLRLEALTGVSDLSRGKLDGLALEMIERLRNEGRFTLLPVSEFHSLLDQSRPPEVRIGPAMNESQMRQLLVTTAKSAKADAVLLLSGPWDSPQNLGKVSLGRGEYKRQATLAVIAVPSGETVWLQQAIITIHEGVALPPERDIRRPVAEALVESLLSTLR